MNKLIFSSFELKTLTQKLAIATLGTTFASALYGQAYYGYIDVAGYQFLGENTQTDGWVDALFPLYQKPNALYFVNFRGAVKTHSQFEGNFGLGSRWLNHDNTQLLGVHGYFDHRKTASGNSFNQVMAGAEYWYKNLFLGANTFIPVGTTTQRSDRYNHTDLIDIGAGGDEVLGIEYGVGFEKALTGFDAELGYELFPGLIGYIGAYTFNAKDIEKSVSGPKARLLYEWSRVDLGQKVLGVFDGISLESEYRNDQERGSVFYAGLRFKVGLGTTPPLKGVARHMIDRVRRDIDLVTSGFTGPKAQLDGTAEVVRNYEELEAAVNNEDIKFIFIDGTINNIAETISLGDHQVLSGGNLTFKTNDSKYTLTGKFMDNKGALTTQEGMDLIYVNYNNTIQGLDLNITNNDESALYAAIKNEDPQKNIGTLTIRNVVADQGQIAIHVAGSDSVDNRVIYANNQVNVGYSAPDKNDEDNITGGVEFIASDSATLNVALLGVNEINTTGDAIGLYNQADKEGTLNITDFTEDTFNFARPTLVINTEGEDAYGVYTYATGGGEVSLAGIDFEVTTVGEGAHAFYGLAEGEDSQLSIKNSFYSGALQTEGGNATGFKLEASQEARAFLENSFIAGNLISTNGLNADAIAIQADTEASILIRSSFNDKNTIQTTGAGANALSITAQTKGAITFENSLNDNEAISTQGAVANAVASLVETGGTSIFNNSLNNNQAVSSQGSNATAISFEVRNNGHTELSNAIQNNVISASNSNAIEFTALDGGGDTSSTIEIDEGSLSYNDITYGEGENSNGVQVTINQGENHIFFADGSLENNTFMSPNEDGIDIFFENTGGETSEGTINTNFDNNTNDPGTFACSGINIIIQGDESKCE